MTPETEYRITQEIAHVRALLTIEEKWLRRQPFSVTREESYRRINWWRKQLDKAEADISEPASQDTNSIAIS